MWWYSVFRQALLQTFQTFIPHKGNRPSFIYKIAAPIAISALLYIMFGSMAEEQLMEWLRVVLAGVVGAMLHGILVFIWSIVRMPVIIEKERRAIRSQ